MNVCGTTRRTQIFIALFMNTGVVMLLVYARPPQDMKFPISGIFEVRR